MRAPRRLLSVWELMNLHFPEKVDGARRFGGLCRLGMRIPENHNGRREFSGICRFGGLGSGGWPRSRPHSAR
jgi:hypothetical protein